MPKLEVRAPQCADEVRRIKQRHLGDAVDQPGVLVNVTVTDVPFGAGTLQMRSSHGPVIGLEAGQHEQPDFAVHLSWAVARELVLDRSANGLELAIANGDIDVEGSFDAFRDWWRSRIGDEDVRDLEDEIRAVTA
jgi:hypothetical protein